jgi:hypothetical protein
VCVFFPLLLLLGAAVWALPVPTPVALGWNAALLFGLGVLIQRMRQPPSAVQGLGERDLAGLACPACGSTQTSAWKSGATVLGLKCDACDRRTPGRPT